MTAPLSYDPASFKGMEQAGWEKNATSYDELLGAVTRHAIEPLLDAAAVRSGTAVLDLCCGPGYGAAAAAARGARATGIDFSLAMVQTAQGLHPAATFRQGDAEALDLESETFDAAICSFGVNHLPDPDRALREAHRILRPGGRFAFSMWCAPGKSKFHQLVLESIRAHGTMDLPLPPAPPPFRFSEPSTCVAALRAAGFDDPNVVEIPLSFCPRAASDVLALTKCAVRLEMMIELQTAQARERIRQSIAEGAETFRTGARLEIPMPAVIASAVKHDLHRFVQAQASDYARVLAEIRSGRKQSHWMWYVFPQLDGLAFSSTSKLYSIKSLAEAEAYLRHPVLGPRLVECVETVLCVEGRSALEIFGATDEAKLRSCATLFAHVAPAGSVFDRLLGKYFQGERDGKTLRLLGIAPEAR